MGVYSHLLGVGAVARVSSVYVCAFIIVLVYACLLSGSVKYWSSIAEKNGLDPLYSGLTERGERKGGGFWSEFFLTSGTDFHGKAALINMALKPGTFYFVHKDHCEAFKFLLHTIASGIKIKCRKHLLLLMTDRTQQKIPPVKVRH